ncbi:MAG: hypothetical protein U9N34_01570 [Candidatus Cloacimonadota bacterium]|nr:hypothetical protein [Candidatus Cloacimonadota bacterium]
MVEQHLASIEHYASILMLPKDIARILELDFFQFKTALLNEYSLESQSFFKGYLKTEVKIRERSTSEDAKDILAIEFDIIDLKEFKAKLNLQLYA